MISLFFLATLAIATPGFTRDVVKTTVLKSRQASFSCESFRKSLPDDIVRGFVDVPEDWTDPKSEHLRIFYYGRPEIDSSTRPVVLIINGGPGFPSQSTYEKMVAELRRRHILFLFFDQRGTGCSSSYPKLTRESASRFHHYGSRDIVRDAEAIRTQLLGKRLWRLFGHSFGARVALRYVAEFPSKLEKVLIAGDSVGSDPATTVCEIKEGIRRSLLAFDLLVSSRPRLGGTLRMLSERISQRYCYKDEANLLRLCGYDVIRGLGHGLDPERFDVVDRQATDLLRPDGSINYAALDKLMESKLWYNVDAVSVLVWQQDYSLFYQGRPACIAALEQLASEGVKPLPWALESCYAKRALEQLPEVYRANGPILTWTDVRSGLKLNPGLNVAEFSGGQDTLSFVTAICERMRADPPLTQTVSPQWTTHMIGAMGHIGVFNLAEFWDELASYPQSSAKTTGTIKAPQRLIH